MVSPGLIGRLIPVIGGVVFSIFLLLNAIPQFASTGDVSYFVKAFGQIITGGQQEISDAVDQIVSGNLYGYYNLIGGLLLTLDMLMLFSWVADKFQAFEAEAIRYMFALFVFAMLSITYNGVVEHQFVAPFGGIYKLAINIPHLTGGSAGFLNDTVNFCRSSPLC